MKFLNIVFVLLSLFAFSNAINAEDDVSLKSELNFPFKGKGYAEALPFLSCKEAKERAIENAMDKCWEYNSINECEFKKVISRRHRFYQILTGGTACTIRVLIVGKNKSY